MKILHEACVITCLAKTIHGGQNAEATAGTLATFSPSESDTQKRANDSCRRERPRSDWNIGSAFSNETDSRQLALLPVESREPSGRTGPGAFSREQIAELLSSDDSSSHADPVVEQDGNRGTLV